MKYISPELLIRINEEEGDDAEKLYNEWEALGEAGIAHYTEIKDRLPPKLAEFINTVCLHDAEWMGLNVSPNLNGTQSPVAVINIRQGGNVLSLIYDLYEEPQWSAPLRSRIFSEEQLSCLYDEVELIDDVTFSHEILVSNGKILRLVFFQFNFFINRSISIAPLAADFATGSS